MAGLARVWLALGGLAGGVLAPGAWMLGAVVGLPCVLRRRGPWRAVAVLALAFAFGGLDASVRSVERQPAAVLAAEVPSCDAWGRTLEDAGGLGLLVSLDHVRCGGRTASDAGAVFAEDLDLPPGRRFEAAGWLVPLGREGFDLGRRRAGAAGVLRVTEGTDLGPAGGMHRLAGAVRGGLAGATEDLGRRGALLRGLTIGDTGGIDPATEEALRRSGLAHLLAVSGSNVAILLGVVALALRRLPLRTRLIASAGVLAAFVAVVGPDASVLRAAGMGAVALLAIAWGRKAEPLHALGLALVVVVALRPGIVYSAGLHLSVAATLGIVLWTQPLQARLHRLPPPLAAGLAATVAAQVAVAPLLAGIFGELPVAGLPANLLALPAVAPATILGLVAGAVAPFAAAAAEVLARMAAPFAGWVLLVGDAFGTHAWASVSVPRMGGFVIAIPVVAAAVVAVPRKLSPPARTLGTT